MLHGWGAIIEVLVLPSHPHPTRALPRGWAAGRLCDEAELSQEPRDEAGQALVTLGHPGWLEG